MSKNREAARKLRNDLDSSIKVALSKGTFKKTLDHSTLERMNKSQLQEVANGLDVRFTDKTSNKELVKLILKQVEEDNDSDIIGA